MVLDSKPVVKMSAAVPEIQAKSFYKNKIAGYRSGVECLVNGPI
jgi:hypothetical protein